MFSNSSAYWLLAAGAIAAAVFAAIALSPGAAVNLPAQPSPLSNSPPAHSGPTAWPPQRADQRLPATAPVAETSAMRHRHPVPAPDVHPDSSVALATSQSFISRSAKTDYLPFLEAVETFLDTSLPEVNREDALEILADSGQTQYDQELALLALAAALHSPSETLRSAAIDSLALIPHREAANILLRALQDPSPALREDAFYALLDKPERDFDALMVEALGNDHARVRQMAAEDLFEAAR